MYDLPTHSSLNDRHDHHKKNDREEEDPRLFPARITKKGNYGYEVRWADGSRVIYSLLAIARAAGGRRKREGEDGDGGNTVS